MDILNKLRKQPENIRKLILWITIIILGLVLAVWWIYSSYQGIKKLQAEKIIEELNLPDLEELPKIEVPEAK